MIINKRRRGGILVIDWIIYVGAVFEASRLFEIRSIILCLNFVIRDDDTSLGSFS